MQNYTYVCVRLQDNQRFVKLATISGYFRGAIRTGHHHAPDIVPNHRYQQVHSQFGGSTNSWHKAHINLGLAYSRMITHCYSYIYTYICIVVSAAMRSNHVKYHYAIIGDIKIWVFEMMNESQVISLFNLSLRSCIYLLYAARNCLHYTLNVRNILKLFSHFFFKCIYSKWILYIKYIVTIISNFSTF